MRRACLVASVIEEYPLPANCERSRGVVPTSADGSEAEAKLQINTAIVCGRTSESPASETDAASGQRN